MSPQERRALLGDELVAHIHQDVDAGIARHGIPGDAIADLRPIFGPVLDRLAETRTPNMPVRSAA